jgi:hypothetical protein
MEVGVAQQGISTDEATLPDGYRERSADADATHAGVVTHPYSSTSEQSSDDDSMADTERCVLR